MIYPGSPAAQAPNRCPRCGSTHYQVAHFAEYVAHSVSQPQRLSQESVGLFVCICGNVLPGRLNLTTPKYQTLRESLEAARRYHEQKIGRSKADVEHEFVSHAEYDVLQDKVQALEAEIQQLSKKKKSK